MSEKKIKPLSQEDQIYSKALIEVLNEKIRQTVRSNLGSDLSSEFEDIVQSVYEAICKQLYDFKSCDNQEALAVTIAARAVWVFRRNHKPTEVLSEDIPATEPDCGLDEILPASTSDTDRKVLTSVFERQDTMVELAADLGVSDSTVRQRLKRAKARLRRTLEENT